MQIANIGGRWELAGVWEENRDREAATSSFRSVWLSLSSFARSDAGHAVQLPVEVIGNDREGSSRRGCRWLKVRQRPANLAPLFRRFPSSLPAVMFCFFYNSARLINPSNCCCAPPAPLCAAFLFLPSFFLLCLNRVFVLICMLSFSCSWKPSFAIITKVVFR